MHQSILCRALLAVLPLICVINTYHITEAFQSVTIASPRRIAHSDIQTTALFDGFGFGKGTDKEKDGVGDKEISAAVPIANAGGGTPVVELAAEKVKVAPLQFFLQIYLVSEQNNPTKGAWVLNKNEETKCLDMYYKDGTGMFSIEMTETNISIQRKGSKPSLQYVLQESVLLHGVLDELFQIAFEVEDIKDDEKLLQFASKDVINQARATLPARKAED